jgi:hypothetical protein
LSSCSSSSSSIFYFLLSIFAINEPITSFSPRHFLCLHSVLYPSEFYSLISQRLSHQSPIPAYLMSFTWLLWLHVFTKKFLFM